MDSGSNEATLTLSSSSDPTLGLTLLLTEPDPGEMLVAPDYFAFANDAAGINRFFLRLPAEEDESAWGGGEQFTYLDLRRGPDYPIWVREQGFIRDPEAPLYAGVELVFPGAGGDYHTTYWPQAAFLSSRGEFHKTQKITCTEFPKHFAESGHQRAHVVATSRDDIWETAPRVIMLVFVKFAPPPHPRRYYFELATPTYSELRFAPRGESESGGHEVYWHRTPVRNATCVDKCDIKFSQPFSLPNKIKISVQKINLPLEVTPKCLCTMYGHTVQ